MIYNSPKGFSLIEILIVVSILAILGLMATGFYRNFVKNVELESVNKTIVFDLRDARSRAMNGEDDLKWGIRFINNSSDYYYELFSTPTDYSGPSTTVKNTVYLPDVIVFTNPPPASSSIVIFNKITATTTAASIGISFENATKTITITGEGNIY